MSLKDLLRGLPLLATPSAADLFGNGETLGDDGGSRKGWSRSPRRKS
jgi:hypothetical protein